MMPNFVHWLRHARECHGPGCRSMGRPCGPGGQGGGPGGFWGGGDAESGDIGAGFGVRRPLRFLAHRLGLSDEQIAALARIVDGLKTERAQASVDHRRSTGALADLLAAETFDAEAAAAAARQRVESTERLQKAVIAALAEIHAILGPAQRQKLAMLIRGGILSV